MDASEARSEEVSDLEVVTDRATKLSEAGAGKMKKKGL